MLLVLLFFMGPSSPRDLGTCLESTGFVALASIQGNKRNEVMKVGELAAMSGTSSARLSGCSCLPQADKSAIANAGNMSIRNNEITLCGVEGAAAASGHQARALHACTRSPVITNVAAA